MVVDKDVPAYALEYDEWYDQHPKIFNTLVAAIQPLLPEGHENNGIEINLATGRFSKALGIKGGVEPTAIMRNIAAERGVDVLNAESDALPYADLQFDFVFMNASNASSQGLYNAFREAYRVLKDGGLFILSFIEKESELGLDIRINKDQNSYYRETSPLPTQKVMFELAEAGFRQFNVYQTLTRPPGTEPEPLTPGYGRGSFIVIRAVRERKVKR